MTAIDVTLTEWSTCSPRDQGGERLVGLSFADPGTRSIARALAAQGMLSVREVREGIEVSTTSYVGRIRIGPVAVSVQPKIAPELLLRLFSYAHDLSSLRREGPTRFPSGTLFQDVLLDQLVMQVKELVRDGLARQYLPVEGNLASPQGRVLLDRMSGRFADARLPCRFHLRAADNTLNSTVLAGMRLASRLTESPQLRSSLRRLMDAFGDIRTMRLDRQLLAAAWRSVNRLTATYEPSLRIIGMLYDGVSIRLAADEPEVVLDGFLYDMNRFFQALVGRFLRESLDGWVLREERGLLGLMRYAADANPRHRRAPVPRPDFTLVERGTGRTLLLDAKYRDLWNRSLPREMLYQLAIYALSQSAMPTTAMLYPARCSDVREARVEIRDPVGGGVRGVVGLRPVDLAELDRVIGLKGPVGVEERQRVARLMLGRTSSGGRSHLRVET